MPNRETVRALVSAFNVHNYARNTVKTNFTLQSDGNIAVLFDKGMDRYHCSRYLDSIKRKIIREFYGIEESNDAEILDTAKLIFDVKSFPFDISRGKLSMDESGRFKFVTPIDKGVIFNLKSHLASSLEKDVLEDIRVSSTTVPFNKKEYLCCSKFPNKESREQFEREFLSRMKSRYKNAPKNPLKIEGNSVYIKDVFDDARFIDSVTRYIAWLKGMGLQNDNKVRNDVKAFKDLIIEFIDQSTELTVAGFIRNFPLNEETAKILIPVVLDNGETRILGSEEALKLSYAFNYAVFNNLYSEVQAELPIDGDSGIYGINLSDPEISHCVVTKIIESSVINAKHELSIDPELRLQALSPAQSPVRVPNGPSSGLTESSSTQQFPTRSKGEELKESPRQGSEKEGEELQLFPLVQVNSAETSKGFRPSTPLSLTAVSHPGPSSSQSLSAAQNVSAAWSHGHWSSQGTSGNKWQPSPGPGPSGLSWKGAAKNLQAETSAWDQPIGFLSLPVFYAQSSDISVPRFQPPTQLSSSGPSSWKVAAQNVSAALSQDPWSQQWQSSPEPGPSGLPWNKSGSASWSSLAPGAGFSSWKGAQAGANISEKEKELFEKLLYTLNLTNYTYGGVYTNFFAKDGKIVSCLHDNVDREKYFQAVRNYIIKEYYGDEKEASKVCDLDEFPFKLNCEEKQEKTVVANISSGALSNLKILFSRLFKKDVNAIDISAVKKVEKREKDEWVDQQLLDKYSLEEACEDFFPDEEAIEEACEGCFPDEETMKIIPIAFDEAEGEYVLDRSRDICEVKLFFKEQLRRFRGTSVAGKGESDYKPLTEEEKELFEELLYVFNLNNQIFECHYTNFIVKNGKIASLIYDGVDVKEYLQEVIDKTKEEYCVNKKQVYDLNEFPFKFLSNCEKNQKTTVVANISRGALLNLKKLFIQEYEKEVEIKDININIVKKAVRSKKNEWADFQVQGHGVCPDAALKTCFPDRDRLKYIPIIKGKGGCYLSRDYSAREVKSFLQERRCAKGTRNATTTFKKIEESKKDDSSSGYSSGFATDAENASSKAGATTSGYESMDCENTGGGSQKRKSPSPEDGGSPRKSPKRDSLPFSGLESLSLSSSSHQIDKC